MALWKLRQTSAGRPLYMELKEFVICHQKCMKRIQHELKEPTLDPEQLEVLMNDYTAVSNQLRHATENLKRMEMSVGGQTDWTGSRTFQWVTDSVAHAFIVHYSWNRHLQLLHAQQEEIKMASGSREA